MTKTRYFYNDGGIRMYLMSFRGQIDGTMGMVFTPDKNKAHAFVGGISICSNLLQENVMDVVYVIRFTTFSRVSNDNPWYLHKSLTGGGTTSDRNFRAEFPTLESAVSHLHYVYHNSQALRNHNDVDKVWIEKVEI